MLSGEDAMLRASAVVLQAGLEAAAAVLQEESHRSASRRSKAVLRSPRVRSRRPARRRR